MCLARKRFINMVQREKYAHECPELIAYQKKHVTEEQRESVNLDDHTTYLNSIREDKSLYPYRNVMSCNWLVQQLKLKHLCSYRVTLSQCPSHFAFVLYLGDTEEQWEDPGPEEQKLWGRPEHWPPQLGVPTLHVLGDH